MAATKKQFEPGDIVSLKSGGPDMTIETIANEHGITCVYCVWFEGSTIHHKKLTDVVLQKVERNEFAQEP